MADAPSFRISMRSTASNGTWFRFTNDRCPSSARPYTASRRPFSSTSVLFAPSPRSETPDEPAASPFTNALLTVPLLLAVIDCTTAAIVCRPDAWMSSRVITSTGAAVSASVRLMLVPVTLSLISCAIAGTARTSATAIAARVR